MDNKKGSKSIVFIIMIIMGIAIIAVASFMIIRLYRDYQKSEQYYDSVKEEAVVVSNDSQGNEIEVPWYQLISVDFDALQAENDDVIGWIFFENEDISYPVLYSGDDSYYLRRSMDGSAATAGSIFLEGENSPDFSDYHSIIYGHNMRNLTMFGKLKYYAKDDAYYNSHQYFQICTNDFIYRYQIFAYENVSADDRVYTIPFGPTEEYTEYLAYLKSISMKDTGVEVTNENHIITLSTCNDATAINDQRFVVQGVLVDMYEVKE